MVAIAAGAVAGSVGLIGFGLDTVVEVSSGLVILWQFHYRLPLSRERQALRLIGVSFFRARGVRVAGICAGPGGWRGVGFVASRHRARDGRVP